MKLPRPLRPSALVFGVVASVAFLKGPLPSLTPIPFTAVVPLVLLVALGLLLLLGFALATAYIFPSLSPTRWRAPAKDVFPFNPVGEPVNFAHYAATAFTALGLSGVVLVGARHGWANVSIPLQFLIVGLGTMIGVRLAPHVFKGRIHEKTYN